MSDSPVCCICLDEFTSPVTLPCGHCFCLGCIGEYWRIQELCLCPLCKKTFPDRPQLITNKTSSQDVSVPLKAGEVPCDVCSVDHPAVKSCLVCLTSYCAIHLQPHYQTEELGRHLLIDVAKNLEDAVCRLHGRKLEKFCRSDRSCVCSKCAQTEHRGHRIVSISKEAAKKKIKLKHKCLQLQREIDDRLREVEKIKSCVDQRRGNVCKEQIVKQLEEEIMLLKSKNSDLELLSQNEDNLLFLQRYVHSTL